MSAPIQFKKAVKFDAKGRICLTGPAGSGKSFTALRTARLLAGPTGKIAAVDTEHGSLSKYADLFDFDVLELDSYSPETFTEALTAAEQNEYAVFVVDSLSHFWMGKDGALEFVDMAKKIAESRARGRIDDMVGWKEFRPHERAMVDRMIASPCHVVVTLRTKTAYEMQKNEQTGKMQRIKVGLAPVQREGLDYEFDLVGVMDDDNGLLIEKTRCPHYTGKVISKPKDADFQPFVDWLKGEKRPVEPKAPPIAAPAASTAPKPPAAASASAPETTRRPEPAQTPTPAEVPELVADMFKMMAGGKAGFEKVFDGFKKTFTMLQGELAGAETYNYLLGLYGVDSWQNFKSTQKARQCVLALYNKAIELRGPDAEMAIPFPGEAA